MPLIIQREKGEAAENGELGVTKMLLLFPVIQPQLTLIVTVDAPDRPSLPCKALSGAAHCDGPGHCKNQMLSAVGQLCLFSISL